jgi:hypothetical protein
LFKRLLYGVLLALVAVTGVAGPALAEEEPPLIDLPVDTPVPVPNPLPGPPYCCM